MRLSVERSWGLTALTVLLVGCYSLTPQDRAADQVADQLTAGAYCHLMRVPAGLDTDAGDVAAARALQRGAHAELASVLRRNSADAGAPDSGIPCLP